MYEILFSLLLAILPACAQEDSNNCAWDASTRGNGIGTSWIALDTNNDGNADIILHGATR